MGQNVDNTHSHMGFHSNTMSSLLSILHKTAHSLEVGSPKPVRNKHESDYVWQGLQQKILSPQKNYMHLEDYSNIFCSTRTHNFQGHVVEIQEILVFRFRLNCTWKWLKTVVLLLHPIPYIIGERAFICVSIPLTFWCRWIETDLISNRWSTIYHHWATMFFQALNHILEDYDEMELLWNEMRTKNVVELIQDFQSSAYFFYCEPLNLHWSALCCFGIWFFF